MRLASNQVFDHLAVTFWHSRTKLGSMQVKPWQMLKRMLSHFFASHVLAKGNDWLAPTTVSMHLRKCDK
jgi:hypothetical protein